MNNDAPQTLDAAGSRVAELEQQLRLSDEGVSRLAQRCLELEQQVLKYEAVLASQGADTEQGALLLPQLFYDSGSGFSPHECLTVAPDSYDELTHEVSAVFELPVEARALRLDPGEFACCITDFSLSDERLSYHILNGNALQEGTMLFMNIDPNLTVESAVYLTSVFYPISNESKSFSCFFTHSRYAETHCSPQLFFSLPLS